MTRRAARINHDEDIDGVLQALDQADRPHLYSISLDAAMKTAKAHYLPLDFTRTFRGSGVDGWVYYVRAGAFVKIGFTTDLVARMKRLQTSSPCKLQLLVAIEGSQEREAFEHKHYATLRAYGEWFKMEGALLDFLGEQYRHQKAGEVYL